MTRHQYGISALVSQTSFCKETRGVIVSWVGGGGGGGVGVYFVSKNSVLGLG